MTVRNFRVHGGVGTSRHLPLPVVGSRYAMSFSISGTGSGEILSLVTSSEDFLFSLYVKDDALYMKPRNYPLYPDTGMILPDAVHLNVPGQGSSVDTPDDQDGKIISFLPGKTTDISIRVSGAGRLGGSVNIYAAIQGTTLSRNYASAPLNWYSLNPTTLRFGLTRTSPAAYDFTFKDINILTEDVLGGIFNISNVHGVRVDPSDILKKWRGLNEHDGDLLTEPTDVRNLARYEYGKPESDLSQPPKAVHFYLNN